MTNLVFSPIKLNELETLITNCVKAALSEKECDNPLAYSKKEFAKLINKSTSFVDQERRAGRLKWKRNGGTVSIPASQLEKYI